MVHTTQPSGLCDVRGPVGQVPTTISLTGRAKEIDREDVVKEVFLAAL